MKRFITLILFCTMAQSFAINLTFPMAMTVNDHFINNYALYVQNNQIRWYINPEAVIQIQDYTGESISEPLLGFIQEALNEWRQAFRSPAITFVRVNNENNARITYRVGNVTIPGIRAYGVAAPRNLFSTNPNFGITIFFRNIFQLALGSQTWVTDFRAIIHRPDASTREILRYLIRFVVKHETGHMLGLVHPALYPEGFTEQIFNPLNLNQFVILPSAIAGAGNTVLTTPLIMEEPLEYFRNLYRELRVPIQFTHIMVTQNDRDAIINENECFPPSKTLTLSSSNSIYCDTKTLTNVLVTYLANNTAITTALRRGEL